MKINRVMLKNYRSHASGEFVFDRGINLLLGKNGAGKSSILEAAGHALFDADLRSNAIDAVARGHKTATIAVSFEGVDGNEYRVERRIGAGSMLRLYLEGEKSPRIEGKERVLQKVKELAGIEANEKNIFQNVITAYQNKIVDIFSDRPADREKTFNQIFDTAIYRQMTDGFVKVASDGYDKQLAIVISAADRLSGQLRDSGELKRVLKEKQAAALVEKERLAGQKKQIESLEAEGKKQLGIKNEIDAARTAISHMQELASRTQQTKEEAGAALALSEEAAKILTEKADAYAAYGDTEKKLRELAPLIEGLEKKQTERDSHKERWSKLTTELKTGEEKHRHLRKLLDAERKEEEKTAAEAAGLQKDCDSLKKEVEELTKTGKARGELEKVFKEQFQALRENQAGIKLRQEKITELVKNRADVDKISEELKIRQVEKKQLLALRAEKHKLEKAGGELQARLADLKDAEDTLSGGRCPYLNEACQNIKTGTSPAQYFAGRRETLTAALNKVEEQLSSYSTIDDKMSKADAACAQLEGDIHRAQADAQTLKEQKALLRTAEKDAEIISHKIKNILTPLAGELNQELADEDFAAVAHRLTDIVTTLREQFKHQQAKAAEAAKNLVGKQRDMKAVQQQLFDTDAEIQRLADKKIELEKEEAFLIGEINDLEAELKDLDTLREKRKELNASRARLKPGYDLYVANQQKAAELESHKNHRKTLSAELAAIVQDEMEETRKLKGLLTKFSDVSYKKLMEDIGRKNTGKEAQQAKVSQLQTEIALAQKGLDENLQREAEHKDLTAKHSMLLRKLELAEKFRDNLRGMGKFVASRLMQTIEISATENFRSITGRSDEIRWVNNEKESYAVLLAHGPEIGHQKRFEMLSGGEQVSVALSLRAAMASALTRANFAIFDEPTINLDAEKKVALAESLQEMLKNLHQAIIVTHDDTFREMAQKIICLD